MLSRGFSRQARVLTYTAAAALLALATLPQAGAQTPAPQPGVTGVWIDHTGRGAVELRNCGNMLCGHIAWLKEATATKGAPATDRKGRPLCGLQIIGELKQNGSVWQGGWIYDPDKDDTFNVEIQLKGQDRLQVMGYMGVKFLSETHMWKRAPATFTTCTPAAPARAS